MNGIPQQSAEQPHNTALNQPCPGCCVGVVFSSLLDCIGIDIGPHHLKILCQYSLLESDLSLAEGIHHPQRASAGSGAKLRLDYGRIMAALPQPSAACHHG